jgi:hypothetical protein
MLIDIEASPTISWRPQRFINRRDDFNQSTATIAQRRASNGHLPPKTAAGELPPLLRNLSISLWHQAVAEPNTRTTSKTAAAQGKIGLCLHERGSQISKEIDLGHFTIQSLHFLKF